MIAPEQQLGEAPFPGRELTEYERRYASLAFGVVESLEYTSLVKYDGGETSEVDRTLAILEVAIKERLTVHDINQVSAFVDEIKRLDQSLAA